MNKTNKAYLVSIALHIGLVSALALIYPTAEPGIGASPQYIEVAFLIGPDAGDAAADDALAEATAAAEGGPPTELPPDDPAEAGASPAADVAAPAETVEATPSPTADELSAATTPDPVPVDRPAPPPPAVDPTEEAASTESPAQLAAVPSERPPVPAEPEPAEAEAPATEAADTSDVPAAEPAQRREIEPLQPAEPVPAAEPGPAAEPAIVAEAGSEAPATVSPEPATEPPVTVVPQPPAAPPTATEAIADTEAELLEERVEDWARSFAALGEWSTATSWADRSGEYTASVSHRPSGNSEGYDEAVVTISTVRDGRTLATEMRMQRLGFSHYAQFIDRWDPQVQIHDDVIEGRFHSNSDISIQRSGNTQPTFLGKVTTARSIDTSRSERNIRRDQVFLGGLETRVGRITMPERLALFADAEPDHVLHVDYDSRLRFTADGGYTLTPVLTRREMRALEAGDARAELVPAPTTVAGTVPADVPFFVIGSADADLYVAGTVNGRVLVYTPRDIVIESDLRLSAHPVDVPSSDDYLGLVSDHDVSVAVASVTGSGDLEIHAAIYARNQFEVRGYRTREAGELKIIGSVTAGSVTATEPRYSTRLVFDQRFAQTRPPRFPVTDHYEIADWDGRWTVVEPH